MTFCKNCQQEVRQVPVRKIDDVYIVEEYCPHCDESTFRYEPVE